MKIRDISLMATGAIATIAVIITVTAISYTPKAHAQSASASPAPAGVSMIVTEGSAYDSVQTTEGGVVVLQDTVNRKVTVVSYTHAIGNTGSVGLGISAPQSFSY